MASLQSIRAAAALLVVYFHAVLQIMLFGGGHTGPAGLTQTPFPLFGKCGVDVFFLLSGLLMWRTTARGPHGVLAFYGKRVRRVVPLYWAVTAVAAAIAILLPDLLKSTRFDAAHVLASLLFIPWPNPAMGGGTDVMTPVVVPGWTLNYEMVFYLAFGLTLPVRLAWRLLANLLLFGTIIAVVIALRDRSQTLAFYDPSLVSEFVIGLALGALLDRDCRVPRGVALLLLPASGLALCWFDAVPPGTGRLIATAIPAFGILFAATSLDLAGRWPAMPFMERLGDASYSLYLTHVFVLAALRTGFSHAGVSLGRPAAQSAFVAASLLVSCAVGLLVHRVVEQPLGAALRWPRRARDAYSSGARGGSASEGGALSGLSVAATDLTRSSSVSGF